MEIHELMIGDYVMVPSELNRIKRIQSTFDLDEASLYRPVPLSPEVLDAIGLERAFDLWTNERIFIKLKGEEYLVEVNNPDGRISFFGTLSYLHQLQHVCSVCDAPRIIYNYE